jgi:nicotinate-nucleotide adenylyltransferase
MKPRIGLFFGSFNPIHRSHVTVAMALQQWAQLDHVRLVLTPHSPNKSKDDLLEDQERLTMVEAALAGMDNLKVERIELTLPQPNYTIDTVRALMGREPDCDFVLLMGADNLLGFAQWKQSEDILKCLPLLVYPRPHYPLPDDSPWHNHPRVTLVPGKAMERSSSNIREALKSGASIQGEVHDTVADMLHNKGHYTQE